MRALDTFSGFWRRFRVIPGSGRVVAELEDDYHCMGVVLVHDGRIASAVSVDFRRAPWTTCPGAAAQLADTFQGLALADFARRGQKTANCTHLHDLAVLAAAHAADSTPIEFDVLIDDPVNGIRRAEAWVNGELRLAWSVQGFRIVEPASIAGLELFGLNAWIGSLEPALAEVARILRWGNVIANGRQIPLEQQSDATRMPPNCFSFQPERAAVARRIGRIRDFSRGGGVPLDGG